MIDTWFSYYKKFKQIKSLFFRLALVLFILFITVSAGAQRAGFNKDEFADRRQALMQKADADMILLFGKPKPETGNPFRQDNDFYYFTGIEDPGSALVLLPASGQSVLLQPVLSAAVPKEIDEIEKMMSK